jgi:serine/threonine protein kinase/tetratricopeptide (TPR) repeat protein
MTWASGTRIGGYEIIAPLGAGGMGEVYRATDLRLGRDVALKVLPAEVASHPGRLARFEREARTVAALNHPGIVVLFSVEDDRGTRFLTMELVEGETLDRFSPTEGLPIARVLDLGIALADALAAAHAKGIVHRDLKPANVMVTPEGRVKVLDFGLAKLTESDEALPNADLTSSPTLASPISKDGQVMGTVPYMAPEQLRGHGADARSDVFAIGIMLYELAAGRRPFQGETHADTSSAILRDEVVPMSALRTDVPGDLDDLVARCLEKDPRARFPSALEVWQELRRVRQSLELGLAPAPRTIPRGTASIAVLPFLNRTADPEDEYFSDGLADELLTMLGKIRGLRVAARASAFSFKGKEATIAEIGRALNVATVLEGSLRRAGNRARVSVQLVKVSDGYHLWSETYDRTLDDILTVQDEIAHAVVNELRTTLLGEVADSKTRGEARADVARAAKGRGTDPKAHRLYLQARHLNERRAREDTEKAIEYLKEALQRDPAFALAWAELGTSYMIAVGAGWVPPSSGIEPARTAVLRSLSLEPDLAEGHAELGRILMIDERDWRGAEASFRRALELVPANTLALRTAGALAYNQNRLDEAIDLFQRALEQDPLSTAAYHNLGLALHAANRFPEAEASYRKSIELAPKRMVTRAYLSLTLLAMGRGEEALAEAAREPNELFRLWALAVVHHAMGRSADSDVALRELVQNHAETAAYQIAEVYAARGEADHAFEWLDRAFAQGDPGLTEILCGPLFRSLYTDPRWGDCVRRAGFEV